MIRLSTPSYIEKEVTRLVPALCPRHNTRSVNHQDYGNINYYQDQYFKKFGGYRSFQGFIYDRNPSIYGSLGSERFLPDYHIEDALKAWNNFRERNEEGFHKAAFEYFFEINNELEKMGLKLPDGTTEIIKDERVQRRNAAGAENKLLGLSDFNNLGLDEEQRRDLSESPMIREVNEILDGQWLGNLHWAIED